MPQIKNLECSRCQATLSAATPQTLCPQCKGALYVRYDLQPLRGIAARDAIAREAATSPWPGMWRYRDVLPDARPVTLGEGWTPMLPSRRFPNAFLKEEGANPTGSLQSTRALPRRHHGPSLRADANSPCLPPVTPPERWPLTPQLPASKPISSCPATFPLPTTSRAVAYGAKVTLVDGLISDCASHGRRAQGEPKAGLTFPR